VRRGDLLDETSLATGLRGADAIVHLAASFNAASEEAVREVNVGGTRSLLAGAVVEGVSRVIYISTSLVYGRGRGRPAREDDPREPPPHIYPRTKAEAEDLVLAASERGLQPVILRLAFVYGDGDPHLTDTLPTIEAWHGAKRLHTVHHADVAQAILAASEPDAPAGAIFNVADDAPVSAYELLQLHGRPGQVDTADAALEQPWDGILDTSRIRGQLGFAPVFPSVFAASHAGAL
jgi:nucleoside-diphosphate-sugar epimerase